MKQNINSIYPKELDNLCQEVKKLVNQKKYEESENMIKNAMRMYPHAPHTHNLYGLLLEIQGDNLSALKHFRAACALDPSYMPAKQNIDHFSSFYPKGEWAFDDMDCIDLQERDFYKIVYDKYGIGHVVKREKDGIIKKLSV
jgi:tetratricopeptide (TPR) repeat protein